MEDGGLRDGKDGALRTASPTKDGGNIEQPTSNVERRMADEEQIVPRRGEGKTQDYQVEDFQMENGEWKKMDDRGLKDGEDGARSAMVPFGGMEAVLESPLLAPGEREVFQILLDLFNEAKNGSDPGYAAAARKWERTLVFFIRVQLSKRQKPNFKRQSPNERGISRDGGEVKIENYQVEDCQMENGAVRTASPTNEDGALGTAGTTQDRARSAKRPAVCQAANGVRGQKAELIRPRRRRFFSRVL